MEGKDIVARARTGSGKTLAYLLPALHRILNSGLGRAGWQTLILVPTSELCEQVKEEASSIIAGCGVDINVTTLVGDGQLRHLVSTAGQVVIATPARVATALEDGLINSRMLGKTLKTMILDEADLLLSYGYEEDVSKIAPAVPRTCQCMLMSATTSDDIELLTKLVLHSPVTLDLLGSTGDEDDEHARKNYHVSPTEIEHYSIMLPACKKEGADSMERLVHLLALLRLGLVQRKVLLFVNSAEEGMRVRLFLDSFGIKAASINAELPLNSRHHILQQFNKGLFDYLIATDDVHADKDIMKDKKRGRKRKQQEEEFGVIRGIDFKGVNTVVNVELPDSLVGYVHRVGRTGRAGSSGTAITFLSHGSTRFADDLAGIDMKPFDKLTKIAVDALRYRAEDIARSITKAAVKEARAAEVKSELLNSQRLKSFFEDRPSDLNLLRHDRTLAPSFAAAAPHLKHLPAYLRESGASGTEILRRQGRGILPARKRRKSEGVDPVKGFAAAPRKGGADAHEPLTEMEKRAAEHGKKERKKMAQKGGFMPKRNVRKLSGRKR